MNQKTRYGRAHLTVAHQKNHYYKEDAMLYTVGESEKQSGQVIVDGCKVLILVYTYLYCAYTCVFRMLTSLSNVKLRDSSFQLNAFNADRSTLCACQNSEVIYTCIMMPRCVY